MHAQVDHTKTFYFHQQVDKAVIMEAVYKLMKLNENIPLDRISARLYLENARKMN